MLRRIVVILVLAVLTEPSQAASGPGGPFPVSSGTPGNLSNDLLAMAEAQARVLSAAVSENTYPYLHAVLASPWCEGYAMLKLTDSRRQTKEYRALKTQELALRDRIAAYLSADTSVATEILLTYGDYVLFVEKRTTSAKDRDDWREHSGGDMFEGLFSDWRLDEALSEERRVAKEVVPLQGAQLLGVPVVRDGRFVCAIYLRIASPTTTSKGVLPQ